MATAEPVNQNELLEEIASLNTSQVEQLRKRARRDLYFLSKGIIGFEQVNPRTHGGLCRFMDSDPALRRLLLMPRGHLKSSIATVADSVRLALDDPDNCRILIANETATGAETFLRLIKQQFESNSVLRALFPELIPTRFQGQGVTWAAHQASIVRNSIHASPTWRAIGVGGAAVGYHFSRIKCDDLIGLEADDSPAVMKEAIDWNDNIEPLLTNDKVDVIDWIGTRRKRHDLYSHVMSNYSGRLHVYTREAIEHDEIIFPEMHTWDKYKGLMENQPRVWFAQYCNNPQAEGQTDFPGEKIRSFSFSADFSEVQFVDPRGVAKKWRLDQLDRVLCADPNSGAKLAPDDAAIVAVGVSPDDEAFVLHADSGKWSPSEFVDVIFRVAVRWKVRVVGIEQAGQQNTEHYFRLKSEREKRWWRIEPLKHGNKNKEERIRKSLEPLIHLGQIYLQASQTKLRQQILDFPDLELFDQIDALAYFPRIARRPLKEEDEEESKKVISLALRRRSRRTGY